MNATPVSASTQTSLGLHSYSSSESDMQSRKTTGAEVEWYAVEQLAKQQQRERVLCMERFSVDALFVLHRLAVIGLQMYNVHLTALERANAPLIVLAGVLLCRGPLYSYVLSSRKASASASRVDILLRPYDPEIPAHT